MKVSQNPVSSQGEGAPTAPDTGGAGDRRGGFGGQGGQKGQGKAEEEGFEAEG